MTEKRFTRITCAVVALAVCLSGAMLFSQGSASGVDFVYEDALFDRDSLMTVEITLPEEDWNSLLENARDEEYVSADITINGETCKSVGMRCKGNSSLTRVGDTDRYSFKVKFDEYISGQTMLGLDKIVFNNTQSDATWMKEYLAYYTMQMVGVDVPIYAFAKIYVNGEFWGLYLAVETLEQSYAERNFGRDYGNLYKVESMDMGGGFEGGDREKDRDGMPQMPDGDFTPPENMQDFQHGEMPFDAPAEMPEALQNGGGFRGFSRSGDGSDLTYTDDSIESYSAIFDKTVFKTTTDADKQRVIAALKGISDETSEISDFVMVDQMLRYIAGNAALGNGDGYFGSMMHNFYLYEKNGKITMLPWDYNLAFGGFGESAESLINLDIDAPYTSGSAEERPIIARLLADETYLETYHEYIRQIGEFYVNEAAGLIDRLDAMIRKWVELDPTKEYTFEEYEASLPQLKEYLRLRGPSMLNQLQGNDEPVDTSSLEISALGSNRGGGNKGGEWRFDQQDRFSAQGAETNEQSGSEDDSTGNGIPGGSMPPQFGERNGNEGMEQLSRRDDAAVESASGTQQSEAEVLDTPAQPTFGERNENGGAEQSSEPDSAAAASDTSAQSAENPNGFARGDWQRGGAPNFEGSFDEKTEEGNDASMWWVIGSAAVLLAALIFAKFYPFRKRW